MQENITPQTFMKRLLIKKIEKLLLERKEYVFCKLLRYIPEPDFEHMKIRSYDQECEAVSVLQGLLKKKIQSQCLYAFYVIQFNGEKKRVRAPLHYKKEEYGEHTIQISSIPSNMHIKKRKPLQNTTMHNKVVVRPDKLSIRLKPPTQSMKYYTYRSNNSNAQNMCINQYNVPRESIRCLQESRRNFKDMDDSCLTYRTELSLLLEKMKQANRKESDGSQNLLAGSRTNFRKKSLIIDKILQIQSIMQINEP